jgi:DNA repair exonuclease SbcCD ATPase subunit
MTVQQVSYLINVDDQFTEPMRQISGQVTDAQKRVTQFASGSKSAADSMRNLTSALGVAPVAQFSGQISALTMQIRSLNQASIQGSSSIGLMRLGLVGLAAAGGVQLGKVLGDLIYNTEEVGKRSDRASQAVDGAIARLQDLQRKSRQEELTEISLIRDPEKQAAREKQYFDRLVSDLERVNTRIQFDEKALQRLQDEFTIFRGDRAGAIKVTEQRINQEERLREQLQGEVDAIRDRNREEAKFGAMIRENKRLDDLEKIIGGIAEQNDQLRMGSEEYRKQQELLLAVTDAERQRIEQLQAERAELEQAEIARQKAEQDRLKTEQASDSYLQGLRTQLILLQEGQDAADEYRAQLAGVSEKAIEEGRKLREEIAALQDVQEEVATSRRPGQVTLAAKETRLLTRATPRDNLQEQMAKDIKKQVDQGAKQLQTANQQLAALRGLGRVPTFSGN